jgi:hypothetical protein
VKCRRLETTHRVIKEGYGIYSPKRMGKYRPKERNVNQKEGTNDPGRTKEGLDTVRNERG